MANTYSRIIVLGVCCFLFTLYTRIWPELFCIVLAAVSFIGLGIMFVFALIRGFAKWRKSSPFWMLPALLCLGFLAASWFNPPLGRLIADRQFQKNKDEYLRVVEKIRNGTIACPAECGSRLTPIDGNDLPHHTRAIMAARCKDGETVVVGFLSDVDAPGVHEGYIFEDSRNTACLTEDMKPQNKWPFVRHVSENWYHFSDQSGL